MKYKLIGNNDYNSSDIMKDVLKNRGVIDISQFLNISEDVLTNPYLFTNIKKAVNILLEYIENKKTIAILVDCDVDGYTSSALLYNYLKDSFPNINLIFITHSSKVHGIILHELEGYIDNIDMLIVPDGGSENYNQHKLLKNMGIEIIIIDHHDVEKRSENAIVINNQLDKIAVNLSGVGMVHKFCKVLDDEIWQEKADEYLDLVAIGLVGDMMPLNDLEIQWYIRNGLKNIKNKFVKNMMETDYFLDINFIKPMDISFSIAPKINSIVRLGEPQDYRDMFKAFAEIEDRTYPYTFSRGKNKGETINENIYEYMTRKCNSLNEKRKRMSAKIANKLIKDINLDDKIFVVDIGTEYGKKGMSRLVANELNKKYNKPSIAYYKNNKDEYKGSMTSHTDDFKDKLNNTDLFVFVAGHQKASGLQIKNNKIEVLSKELNKIFKDEIFEKTHEVDYIIPFEEFEEIGGDIIEDICKLDNYFGRGFESPYIFIENVNIPINEETVKLIGSSKNTIKINKDEITYIKFKANEEEYNNLVDWKDTLRLNIIGKCSLNEYNDAIYPQIIIEDYEILDNDNEQNEEEWEW